MTMMEDGGLQRASIAIKLLAQKAATDPSLGGGILEAKGMRYATQGSTPSVAWQRAPGSYSTYSPTVAHSSTQGLRAAALLPTRVPA